MVASYLGCETSQDSYVHAHSTMHALQVVNYLLHIFFVVFSLEILFFKFQSLKN